MISTHSREGSRPRALRLLSRIAAVVVVGASALGVPVLGGASAASADEDPDAVEPVSSAVEMIVSTGSGTPVEPDSPLAATVTLHNDTDADLSEGIVTVQVNTRPLADGAALDAWLDEDTVVGAFQTVAAEATPVVRDGEDASIAIDADGAQVGSLDPGVYAVRARLSGASTPDEQGRTRPWDLAASTVLVVGAAGERSSAVLVPITATPEDGALLTAAELDALTGDEGALTGQLDAITGTSAILAVDPAIPASIRILGASAPQSATQWLARLEGLPNDVFALQFADADPLTQAQADLDGLLPAPQLSPLLRQSDFPSATPSPAPSITDDAAPGQQPVGPAVPGADGATPEELPDDETLTAIRGERTGMLWPRGDAVAELAALRDDLGDDGAVILPSTAVADADSPASASTAHARIDGMDVIVADARASARLSAAVQLDDRAAMERELTAAAGHAFFAAGTSSPVVLALDRSETRSPAALRAGLGAFSGASPTLAQLRDTDPAERTLAAADADSRGAALTRMLGDETRMNAFASILDEPALLLAPTRIRLLRTIGVGLDEQEFAAAMIAWNERVRTTLNAVTIQQPKPVQLFTAAAPLPVWVRNDLPWPVNVALLSSPSDTRLDIQPVTTVEALASSSTRVNVPIEARVASGDVNVTFRLTGPTGVPIGQPEVADVTLRAEWEGIGLGILAGLVGLLLVLGIVRTVRRKRSDATEPAGPAPDVTEAGTAKGIDE